jgi:hypothetical protein
VSAVAAGLILGVGVVLSGCDNPSTQARVETIALDGPSSIVAEDTSSSVLVVEPSVGGCGRSSDDTYVATIAWRIGEPYAPPVVIRVTSSDGTVFAEDSGPSGQAVTGSWVVEGLAFFAVDATGNVLATVTAPAGPCE